MGAPQHHNKKVLRVRNVRLRYPLRNSDMFVVHTILAMQPAPRTMKLCHNGPAVMAETRPGPRLDVGPERRRDGGMLGVTARAASGLLTTVENAR